MTKITKIWAREILDSRGIPTIETACKIDSGHVAVTSVPAGTSTGIHESLELRDKDNERYFGKGVLKAVSNVNDILGPNIVGLDATKQSDIDKKMIDADGTKNKSKYGANSILSISQAVTKAAALAQNKSLFSWINTLSSDSGIKSTIHVPSPLLVMIEGGMHGAGNLDFQEYLVMPASSKKYSDALRQSAEVFMQIGKDLKRKGAIHSFGQEGGYAPNLFTNADALEVIVESIKQTPYQLGTDIFLGLDVAASVFYKNGQYTIRDKSSALKDSELLEYYKHLNSQYHLAILEDAFQQDAWESWNKLCSEMQNEVTIVGDDLLTTNMERVRKAIEEKSCNAILVKPNQVGTITETLQVIKMAKDANWKIIVSHRGGETNDWFIADFAVGIGADFVKFGAPARGERVVKYNRLSSIELELQQRK